MTRAIGAGEYKEAPRDLVARARTIAATCERHGVTLPDAASGLERFARPIPDELWAELETTS